MKARKKPSCRQSPPGHGSILMIACAALAREITALGRLNGWEHLDVCWLPAKLHNTPAEIPGAVSALIEQMGGGYDEILVAYGDCGTVGELDAVLSRYGARRLAGPHCYSFLAGPDCFEALQEEECGSFYLTDFLVRNFDRLVVRGLGLDRYPELRSAYFGNYRRVVYLAQTRSERLEERARECALQLGLDFEYRFTGLAPLAAALGVEARRASKEASRDVEDAWSA